MSIVFHDLKNSIRVSEEYEKVYFFEKMQRIKCNKLYNFVALLSSEYNIGAFFQYFSLFIKYLKVSLSPYLPE